MKKLTRVITAVGLTLALLVFSGCWHKETLTCGPGTHEQEKAASDGKECVPDVLPTEQQPLKCGAGTHEQGEGIERECVPDLSCGPGTFEQGEGIERECVPDPCYEQEQGEGVERECAPETID